MPQLFTNNARALVLSAISAVDTSVLVTLSLADTFPTANTGTAPVSNATNWFKATLQDTAGNIEIVYVRTRTSGSNVFANLLRGQEGTAARAFAVGSVVGLRLTAEDHAAVRELVDGAAQKAELALPDAAATLGVNDGASGTLFSTVQGFITLLMGALGSRLMGYLRPLTGAVQSTLHRWLNTRDPSIFEFMSEAQIADYQARTAITNPAGALDLTAPIQAAIHAAYAAGQNLYCPPGAAKVNGLEIPTNTAGYEDRGDAWLMYGAGAPQPFARNPRGGTLFIGTTDVPVLRYHQRRAGHTASGNSRVKHIRLEQRNTAATSPVVLWDSISENAEFSQNVLVQFGLGDGFKTNYQIKANIERNFALYGGYFDDPPTRSAAGVGFNIPSAGDAGLLTVRKNSARGFDWGYVHGDGVNDSSGALFLQNEASDCTNGMDNKAGCTATTIQGFYAEGITGTCVRNRGNMTTIAGGMHYLGFSVGIDDSDANNYGTLIQGNYLETSGSQPCTLIKVASSGIEGGPAKNVIANQLLFSASGGLVTGVIGIEKSGTFPRFNIQGNAMLPRGAWVGGAGTVKILDLSVGGTFGHDVAKAGDFEFPWLAHGAISLGLHPNSLTQANVSGSTLVLPSDASYFQVNASSPVTINIVDAGAHDYRIILLELQNNNATFANTGQLILGSNFSGPGTLLLLTYSIGATKFAKQICRSPL